MSGYHSSTDAGGMHFPRKPLLKSVALPAGSPMHSPATHGYPRPNPSSTSRWFPNFIPRSQTPAPPMTQRRDSSFHEVPLSQSNIHTPRTRKSSVSSNTSDRSTTAPLKGILKKPGSSSRSSTPAPAPAPARTYDIPPLKRELSTYTSSSSRETASGYHHHRSESKASSSSTSSRIDGYSSDSHMLLKRKVSPDVEAPGLAYDDANGKPVGDYRKTPLKVPMKAEAIALNWPLTEPNRTSPRKQRLQRSVFFDLAFDPRKSRGVTIPIAPDLAHRVDMPPDMIRLPASTHCTLTEMRISLDREEFKRWPIKVKRKEGVRCLDIFEAIYKTLQHRLTDEDIRAFGLSDYNKQRGMRRVDLLRGRRFFRGIKQSGDEWTLLLDDYCDPSRH